MEEKGPAPFDWTDAWGRWQKMQAEAYRAWMESWGAALSGWFSGRPGAGEGGGEGSAQDALSIYRRWMDNMRDMVDRFVPPASGVGPETFARMFHGAEVYSRLHSLWIQMYEDYRKAAGEGGAYDPEAVRDLLARWGERYREIVNEVFAPALPEQLRWIAELYSGDIPLTAGGFMLHLWAPWAGFAQRMASRGVNMKQPSPREAVEVYEEWRRAYEESFGRLLRAPVMGYYRESMEKYTKTMDSLNEFGIVLAQFYAYLQGAGAMGFEKLQERLADMEGKGGGEPMSFRDFYRLWWQTNEDIYVELFRSEEFARLLGQLVDKGMQFRAAFRAYVEEATKELPFPNRTEMDYLYRTVDRLKREVRLLKRELGGLKGGEKPAAGEG
ncbi:MAG: hypothetical protein H5T73_08660 [Actinobacteria bacterium]|nr:hypothetical protein [Actinomycetota bacterium]